MGCSSSSTKSTTLAPSLAQGSVLLRLNRLEGARDSLNRALVIDSDLASAWIDLAEALWRLVHVDEARDAFETAIALQSSHKDAHELRRRMEKRWRHRFE